jgi:hypothetical protein
VDSIKDDPSIPRTTTSVRAKYRLPTATTASDRRIGSVGRNSGPNDVPQLSQRHTLDHYFRMFGGPTHCLFRNVRYRRVFALFVSAILHQLSGQRSSRMPAMSHSLGHVQKLQLVVEESAAMPIRFRRRWSNMKLRTKIPTY